MREIKFRGMSINGGWHYGLLCIVKEKHGLTKSGSYISNSMGMPFAYHVRPETVGQFTGLKGKNGVEIYEGDVVRYTEWKNNTDEVNFETTYKVVFDRCCWWLTHVSDRYQVRASQTITEQALNNDGCKAREIEIIGNIYENPELIN